MLLRRAGDVIEKRAELRSAQFDARVGDGLDESFEIELCSESGAGAVQDFQSARLITQLGHTRFKSFVDGKNARFELFAIADVVIGPAQQGAARAVLLFGVSFACDPVEFRVPALHPEFDVEAAPFFRARERRVDLENVIGKNVLLPLLEVARRCHRVETEERRGGRAPKPVSGVEIVFKRADPARRLGKTQPILITSSPACGAWSIALVGHEIPGSLPSARIALASVIARIFASAMCRGR
jgi:hypothetical protein